MLGVEELRRGSLQGSWECGHQCKVREDKRKVGALYSFWLNRGTKTLSSSHTYTPTQEKIYRLINQMEGDNIIYLLTTN